MRIVTTAGAIGPPILGVPPVAFCSDGGLLDVVFDPAFRTSRQVFFTFVEPRQAQVQHRRPRRRLTQVSRIFAAGHLL